MSTGSPAAAGARRQHRGALPAAALLLAPLLFFWPLFTPIPGLQQTIISGDFLVEYFPQRVFVSREFWHARLPLWNPHIYAGNAGIGEPQNGVFYPPAWITIALGGPGGPPWWLMELEALAHLGLGGLFMFLLARRVLRRDGPALVAAAAYMFGGYLTSWPLNQLSVLESSIWLPLMVLLLDLGAERGARYYVLAGITWAVSFFAGHPQAPLYGAYVAGAYTLLTIPSPLAAPRAVTAAGLRRAAIGLLLFAAVALGLSAVQILPTRELEQQSGHPQMALDLQSRGLAPAEIGALLVPLHWGNQAVYAGILPLGLALFALAVPAREPRPRRSRWLWALIAAGGLALSFGGATPLYWLARAIAPGFTLIRDQERAVAVWSFGVCMLCGYGAAALAGPAARTTRARIAALALSALALLVVLGVPLRWRPEARPEALALYTRAAVFALLAAGVFLAATFSGRAFTRAPWRRLAALRPPFAPLVPALLVLIVADLYLANGRYALSPGSDPAPLLQAVRFFQADPARPFRVSSEGLLPGGGDAGMLYDFEDVVGSSSLEPAQYGEFWERARTDQNEGTLLALLNVKYILTRRQLPETPGTLVLGHSENGLNLYRVEQPLPRAYVVYSATLAQDGADAAARLRAPDFDPRREVVLAAMGGVAPAPGHALMPVALRELGPSRWSMDVSSLMPGWLVLSQRSFPGWRAYVDGRPVDALAADIALSAVPVPGGTHHVDWVYEPHSVWIGGAISLAALVAALAVLRAAPRAALA